MKKLAVCDFDGTLSKEYISMQFLDYLYEKKIYPAEFYNKQIELLNQHKKSILSYDDWCENWGEVWVCGLKGQSIDVVARHAADFFQVFKKNIYPVSYRLINYLKEKNYHVICLSVGASEVINLAGKELGMNKVYSTQLAFENRKYTGKLITNLHKPRGKEELLKLLIEKDDFAREDSLGLGDSDSDVEFMNMVEIPVAVNPSEKLFRYAKEKGWPVFDFEILKPELVLNIFKKIV